ncbi:hypothetical protein EAH86_06275 [Pedococcus bigeumensis]|uniref:Uncharacterized protein n=1 Tax=Pedococcus bigeumensis TaxID=433644 RepID=A0A502D1L3_9MICO|nr:hypothetical protein EAH86_06275 [Pedococcus bigeumensis]
MIVPLPAPVVTEPGVDGPVVDPPAGLVGGAEALTDVDGVTEVDAVVDGVVVAACAGAHPASIATVTAPAATPARPASPSTISQLPLLPPPSGSYALLNAP